MNKAEASTIVVAKPNFRGDTVRFVRRDDAGNIVGSGFMHRKHIRTHAEAGERIEEVADDHPGLRSDASDTGFRPILPLDAIRAAIRSSLAASDRYFTTDALDNVSASEQASWREYRRTLREAAKCETVREVVARLPALDPKGADPFLAFRSA